MNILIQDLLFAGASVFYLVLALHLWRTRWAGVAPNAGQSLQPWERGGAAVAIGAHGLGLYLAQFSGDGMRFSFAIAISAMLWLAAAIYWIENLRSRLESIQALVLALAGLSSLLPIAFDKTHSLPLAHSLGFRLHFVAGMAAYSLFALAALQAFFLNIAERRLHNRSISRGVAAFPPILVLEFMLFRMVSVGFLLLTAAVGSGLLFSDQLFGKPLSFDHKTLFALVSWMIFAALLAGRHYFGWRGKIAQRWLFSGFFALLLAYVGSRFVLEIILGR